VISRRPDVLYRLHEDTKDSFKYRERVFPPYGRHQLFQILKQRAEMALYPGAVDDDVLYRIAEKAEPVGSARYAIDLLAESASLAEK